MNEKKYVKTVIHNEFYGLLHLVISLDGAERVSIPLGESRTINSLENEPFARYSKVEYTANGTKLHKRKTFKVNWKKDSLRIKLLNKHDGIINYRFSMIYNPLILPKDIPFEVEVNPLEPLARYKEIVVHPDAIVDSNLPQMQMLQPIARGMWNGKLRKDDKFKHLVPNITYIERSEKELKKLEAVRKSLQQKLWESEKKRQQIENHERRVRTNV